MRDERAVDEPVAGAAVQDGLDDDTRIEIALTSDDPEWIAYTFTVLGYLFPVNETTMARLEKRALTLTLERTAFGNEALENAIITFIERRIAVRPDTARPFIYPMLSLLGSDARDTRALAYAVLLNVASDRPEYFTQHVDALTAMQCWGSETARVYAAGIVAALAGQRPEYFPDAEGTPSSLPMPGPDAAGKETAGVEKARAIAPEKHQALARDDDPTGSATIKDTPPQVYNAPAEPVRALKPDRPEAAQPEVHKEPAPTTKSATPVTVQPEVRKEPTPTTKSTTPVTVQPEARKEPARASKPASPVAAQPQEIERQPDGGKRSLTFGLTRKRKGGNPDSPASEATSKKASGTETDEMSGIIDSLSDITRMIKTGLPAAGMEPVVPAKKSGFTAPVAGAKARVEIPVAATATAAPVAKDTGPETGTKSTAAIIGPEKAADAAAHDKKIETPPAEKPVISPKAAVNNPKAETPEREPAKLAVLPAVATKIQRPVPSTKGRDKNVPRPKISIRPLKSDGQNDRT